MEAFCMELFTLFSGHIFCMISHPTLGVTVIGQHNIYQQMV